MCKRDTDDPLVRKFLDDYGVNLLRLPRENASCGDLYVKNGRRVSAPGDLRGLLDPPPELPPVTAGEKLADLAGTISKKISFEVGIGVLEAFLAALGAAGIVDKLKAELGRSRDSGLRFRFLQATRDSIDPIALGNAFFGSAFKTDHPLVSANSEFYVVGGVVRTPSISVALEDRQSHTVDLGAEVLHAVSADANVTVEREDTGEVTYRGRKPLAIGVELYSLHYDVDRKKFEMAPSDRALALRGRPLPPPPPALFAEDDEALLDLAAP
jgi:hypothetical protein